MLSLACCRIQDLKDLRIPEHVSLEGLIEGASYALADPPSAERMVRLLHFMGELLEPLYRRRLARKLVPDLAADAHENAE